MMNRRTFLMAMSAFPFARITPPLAASESIALYEPALAQGRALAHYAERAGILSFALHDDIGVLWHAQRARLTGHAGSPASVLCALRDSDRFVLERFAAPHGMTLIDVKNVSDPDLKMPSPFS
jgi:hypothetical protein